MHEQGKVGRIWAKGDSFMHVHEHNTMKEAKSVLTP